VSDPSVHFGGDQVFFGATVSYEDQNGGANTITILGIDEADSLNGQVSWVSPIAQALLKARVGEVVKLQTPKGLLEIEVLKVAYPSPKTKS
jgi:transcription elongation factor GreB